LESQNIFITVSKYPYNPNRTPRENQHTAFFAYVLNRDKALLNNLVNTLLSTKSQYIEKLQPEDYAEVIIHKSETINGQIRYPDMKIRTLDSRLTIYVENKIDSLERKSEEGSQLIDYLNIAKANSSNENFVIYLTKSYEPLPKDVEEDEYFAGKFLWGKISTIIREYDKSSTNHDNITSEFLDYMKECEMTESNGFDKEYSEIWMAFNKFRNIKNEFLEELESKFKERGYKVEDDIENTYSLRTISKSYWNTKGYDRFFIDFGFDLVPNPNNPDQNDISLITELVMRRRFYDIFKSKVETQLFEKAIIGLKEKHFNRNDENYNIEFQKYTLLSNITKNYTLPKEKQLRKIIDWVTDSVTILEESKLLNLLEEYR